MPDSHDLCPLCNHEYGYHGKSGCQKECCSCGSNCGI